MPARPQKGPGTVPTVTPGSHGRDKIASCPQDPRVMPASPIGRVFGTVSSDEAVE
jgi:hypothetical protein